MMEEKLITIIVPVYNKEKYIDRCLESLVNQTYQKLEILLIDDGSKDKSFLKCKEWERKDNRVRVLKKENGGVSSARNYGLAECKGDFFCFVDPDDYCVDCYIENLYVNIGDASLIYCYPITVKESGKRIVEGRDSGATRKMEVEKFSWISQEGHYTAWGVLYRSDLYKEIRFAKELSVGEDTLFFAQCVCRAQEIIRFDRALYVYVENPESCMREAFNDKKLDELKAWKKIIETFVGNKYMLENCNAAYAIRCKNVIQRYCGNAEFRKKYYKKIRSEYRKYCKYILSASLEQKMYKMFLKNAIAYFVFDVWMVLQYMRRKEKN